MAAIKKGEIPEGDNEAILFFNKEKEKKELLKNKNMVTEN